MSRRSNVSICVTINQFIHERWTPKRTVIRLPLFFDLTSPKTGNRSRDLILRLERVEIVIKVRVALSYSYARRKTRVSPCRHSLSIFTKGHIPISSLFLTKQRNSRLGSTWYHFLRTSSSSYFGGSISVASGADDAGVHPSNTRSGSRSCDTKSEDFRSKYTSMGDVHLRGAEDGRIHDASYAKASNKHLLLGKAIQQICTFGAEKLSFGKTAP